MTPEEIPTRLEEILAEVEARGGILWEPDKEERLGWGLCPCCEKRELRIKISADKSEFLISYHYDPDMEDAT